jgi:hypothetical protein
MTITITGLAGHDLAVVALAVTRPVPSGMGGHVGPPLRRRAITGFAE